MKVLISGAGTAGLSVAYWLNRFGFTPTIIESAPVLRTGGYKIDVRGEALKILHRAGIYDAVVAANTDMQGALLVDKNGKIIHEMSGNAFGHRLGDDQEIMRGTLNQILMDQITGIEIIFGDSIKAISQTSDAINVEFMKSDPRSFDILIGADGLHSNIRRLVFGDEKAFSHELGIYLCVFSIPNYLNLDRIEMEYTELGRVAGVWSTRGDKNAKAYFAFVSPTPVEIRDVIAQQQLVKQIFSNLGGEIPKLLNFMSETDDFYFDAAAQIRMDRWFSGRVVLLGDAAYCASPMSGQGTSLALVGAYVLAGELAVAKGDYQIAFDQYEKIMRPYINLNQELGIRSAKLFRSQEKKSPLTWLIGNLMRILPGYLVEFFINRATKRINQAANSIVLKDYASLMAEERISICEAANSLENLTFKPFQENDISLLRNWLNQPHVNEFWQETDDDSELREKYLNKLTTRSIKSYTINCKEQPIGYIQSYQADQVGNGWWPDATPGTYGIDLFIGEPDLIGKGIGSRVLNQFISKLCSESEVKEIIIDPDPNNVKMHRVCEKNGFSNQGIITTPNGKAVLFTKQISK